MDYIRQIKEFIKKSGGIISSKELKSNNIPTIYLTRMVNGGELTRVDRGMYIDASGDYDEYYFFNSRYNVPVFSYISSLYLHQFTDIIPQKMEVTVYKGYNPHCIRENAIIHYVTKEIYDLGIVECETMFGNVVKAYDLERTICDFIRNRNKIEIELFSRTINRYIKYQNKDMSKLYSYSKKMKIYEKVKDVLELIYE